MALLTSGTGTTAPTANNYYVSDRRLLLDKDGNMVEGKDPAGVTLLVGKGGKISFDEAQKHGIINENQSYNADGTPAVPALTTGDNAAEVKAKAGKADAKPAAPVEAVATVKMV